MPPQGGSEAASKRYVRQWFAAEWKTILTSLVTAFLLFAIPLAFKPVRNWIWPPPVPAYPVVCTAEPVWRAGEDKLTEVYLVNTLPKDLTGDDLRQRLETALGDNAKGASTAVLFPYLPGKAKAESAAPDDKFNEGKGTLIAKITDRGVIVQPLTMASLAILRVNVRFPRKDDDLEFSRGAKDAAGMFDLKGPESGCFTRP